MANPTDRRRVPVEQDKRQPYDSNLKMMVISYYATASISAIIAIFFSVMDKCLKKSKYKLVFKWKQQRAHRATGRYGSKFWLLMQS